MVGIPYWKTSIYIYALSLFKNRYKHKATLKFKPNNILRFIEFMAKKETLPLHGWWCFLDEKHLPNKDVVNKKARVNPITGILSPVIVSGIFCKLFTLFAVISKDKINKKPVAFYIAEENGTVYTFMVFIMKLLCKGITKLNIYQTLSTQNYVLWLHNSVILDHIILLHKTN